MSWARSSRSSGVLAAWRLGQLTGRGRQLTPPWCQPSSASRPTRLVAPALVATRSHLLERHVVGDRSSAVQRGGRSGAGRWRGRGGGGRRCRGGLVCQGEQRPGTADRFEGAPERCCARAGG